MINQRIIPTTEPFFFAGGNQGVLLIHGFTGTPKEMRPMGEDFARRGYTVLGIRLAGHATNLDDIARTHWEDWLTSVEDGLHLLQNCTDKIFVAGLSMGGILTLLASARFPVIQAAAAISAPYRLPNNPLQPLLPLLAVFTPQYKKGPPDWHDPANLTQHRSYATYPTRSMLELRELMHEMVSSLPHVQIPMLLVQSKGDHSIPVDSIDFIYDRLGSSIKEKLWVSNSGHVVTREPEKERVFEVVDRFWRETNNH